MDLFKGLGNVKASAEKAVDWGQKIGTQVYRVGSEVAKKTRGKLQKKAEKAISMIGSTIGD